MGGVGDDRGLGVHASEAAAVGEAGPVPMSELTVVGEEAAEAAALPLRAGAAVLAAGLTEGDAELQLDAEVQSDAMEDGESVAAVVGTGAEESDSVGVGVGEELGVPLEDCVGVGVAPPLTVELDVADGGSVGVPLGDDVALLPTTGEDERVAEGVAVTDATGDGVGVHEGAAERPVEAHAAGQGHATGTLVPAEGQ